MVDKRSAFVLEGGEDDVFHRPAPEAGAFMQVSDELTPKDPKVVAMFAQCFAALLCTDVSNFPYRPEQDRRKAISI